MALQRFSSITAEQNCQECNASLYLHVQIPTQRFCTSCQQFTVEEPVKIIRQPAPQQVDIACQCKNCMTSFKCVALLPKYQSCPHCGHMTPYQKNNLWWKYHLLLFVFGTLLIGLGAFLLFWLNPFPQRNPFVFVVYLFSLFILHGVTWFFFGRFFDLNATSLAKRRKISHWIPHKIIGKNLKTHASPRLLVLLCTLSGAMIGLSFSFSWFVIPNAHPLTTFLKVTLLYASFALFALSGWQLYQETFRPQSS